MFEKFVPIKAIKIAQLTNKAFFKVMFWRRIKLSIFDFFYPNKSHIPILFLFKD